MTQKTSPQKINPRTQRARNALMDATHKLVSERPVSDISLTEIAEMAGVSRPTVYNLFRDTPTLVAATAVENMVSIFKEIHEALPQGNDEEYLHRVMQMFIDRVYEERTFSRNAMFGPSSVEITAAVVDLLSDTMRDGFIGTRLRATSDDIEDRLTVISAGVIWLLTQWLDSDFKGVNAPNKTAKRFSDTILALSR